MMINNNGSLIAANQNIFSYNNRGFKYGDGVFETLKVVNSKVIFLEEHYFRLMASMRILRMEIPSNFTLEFFEKQILETVRANNLSRLARVRMTVYRNSGGLYTPQTNKTSFIVETTELIANKIEKYEVELFKDFYINTSYLSTIKTTNRILNVVASIFAQENDYNTCLLINEHKNLVEVSHGNIFFIFGNKIVTPPISDGCIKGIIRNKIIDLLSKNSIFSIEERSISPFEIQKADEFFITNSIIDIQSVNKYRKKSFATIKTSEIKDKYIKEYNL